MMAMLEKSAPARQRKAAKPAKQKILLVDDNPAIPQILQRLLDEEDYFVLTATNGIEALELAKMARFDLVLLDLNIPVKDGWETSEELSRKNPWMPIILITAWPNQFFPARAEGGGALLEKPLDFTNLFHTIHDLLEEPAEARLARLTGRASAFRCVPPIPNIPEIHGRVTPHSKKPAHHLVSPTVSFPGAPLECIFGQLQTTKQNITQTHESK